MAPAIRIVFCCALSVVASGCTAPVTESELPLDRTFRIDGSLGEHRSRFLFDTGFTVTTLGAAAADRWNLAAATKRTVAATDAHGVVRSVDGYVRTPVMQIGETRFDPFDAPVIAFPPGLEVDAVLGRDAMQPLAWIVDVPGGRLHVVNAGNLDRRLAELYPGKTWTAVPLLFDGASWTVPVEVAGSGGRTTLRLHLDTGAGTTSLPAAIVAQLALPDGQAERQRQDAAEAAAIRRALEERGYTGTSVKVSSGIGTSSVWGEGDSPWFLLGGLQLGRISFESLTVHDSGARSGLLGTDVLGRIVWALDGPSSRLLVRDP